MILILYHIVTAEVDDWERKIADLRKQTSSQRSSSWEVTPFKRPHLHSDNAHDEDGMMPEWEYGDRSPQVTYIEHTRTHTVAYERISTSESFANTGTSVPWYRRNRVARSPVTRESFRTGLDLLSESQGKNY